MRLIVLCLTLGITACSAAAEDGFPPPLVRPPTTGVPVTSGGKVIGPAGGRLSVGPVALEFPEGALAEPVRITVAQPAEGMAAPEEPAAMLQVVVGPEVGLRRPVRVTFTTAADVLGWAVGRQGEWGVQGRVWLPLPAQQTSPGLIWGQTSYLGTFGLVAARCCKESIGVDQPCEVGCDVGPLRYACEGLGGGACCDPYARNPSADPKPRCP